VEVSRSAEAVARSAWGRFDDVVAGTTTRFDRCQRELVASTAVQVPEVLAQVQAATEAGWWAFGYVGYEAAPGLDDSLVVAPSFSATPGDDGLPPAWFGLYPPPTVVDYSPLPEPAPDTVPDTPGGYQTGRWTPVWSPAAYRNAVDSVQQAIAAGETYQCNLTMHLRCRFSGDAERFYDDLIHAQRCRYGTYIDLGRHAILSASPELFFEWSGDRLTTRPMKGTARRGRTTREDEDLAAALLSSPKERAENVIVVDLLRNDLGKIAQTGTVHVPQLLNLERYETVWQLTSDVVGTTRSDVALLDVFRALFPCGSVTGAPKAATMRLIRDTEAGPRGIYCGAIGLVAPNGGPYRARFSVAIRTAVIDRQTGRCEYGVGSGITWDSDAQLEYAELQAKTAIFRRRPREFELLETMAYLPATGVRNLERHLRRLSESARYFGFPVDVDAAREHVLAAVSGAVHSTVRLRLTRVGRTHVDVLAPPTPTRHPVVLEVDRNPVDSSQPWLAHKTTHRGLFAEAAARHPAADDVVLVNELGRITQTTIANIAVRQDSRWLTPPVADGCLPGVERARLIDAGVLAERPLTPADLAAASEIALVSSLRGWRPATLRPPLRAD
jgi:para-aminobenzoate synthetase/4-amino-4-deoxychorismate lyase